MSKGEFVNLDTFRDISKKIEITAEENSIGYLEAAIDYCDKNDLEPEFIGEIIAHNPNLKAKVTYEAETLHYIKKVDRLPLDD